MRCSARKEKFMNPEDVKVRKEKKMTLAEAITKFSIEVLQLDETKNSPEMVAAITELLKIERVSNRFK